jgi:diacylglycerol O-acyltransferase / wax synthase
MPMERLTAEDQLMLWPDEMWPQDIGALAVLDGSSLLDPGGRFRIEAVREVIAGRLHLVPPFRQLLYVPPRRLGEPLWVDAPAFNLTDHVAVLPVPAPGEEAQLLLAVERLRRRRLDRSRPLWEMWFLTGLPKGRVGLFVRMHHAIADGIAGVATVGAFLDTTPNPIAGSARPWAPAPMPTDSELLDDKRQRYADELGRMFSTLAHPVTTLRRVRATWPMLRKLVTGKPAPQTSLDRRVGPGRNLALIRSSLEQVKQIAHAHDASVNDVLLAVTAGGLRGLLRSRGEPVADVTLPVYVPITLRHGPRAQARGNLIGQMVVPLPIGVCHPGRRLRQIAVATAQRKAESHPNLGTMLRSRIARWAMLKLLDRQPVSVTTADIPGPQAPMHLAGARLLEVFPVLPLIGKVSLGVGALSYAGQFNITAVADQDAHTDLDVFAAGIRDELRTLTLSAGSHEAVSGHLGPQPSNRQARPAQHNRRDWAVLNPQDYSARTHYRPPAAWYRRLNWLGVPLTSLGLAPRDAVTLEVRGRKSGKLHRIPILRTRYRDADYLVALGGESQWVRNVRAADGHAVIRRRKTRPVRLAELPAADRPEIIAAYLRAGLERSGAKANAKQARYFFGLDPDPSIDDIQAIADYYPVFRVVYRDD